MYARVANAPSGPRLRVRLLGHKGSPGFRRGNSRVTLRRRHREATKPTRACVVIPVRSLHHAREMAQASDLSSLAQNPLPLAVR
jgi:hypothetical protein